MSSHPALWRRAGLTLAVPALALSGLVTSATPATAAGHATGPVTAGADWLIGELTDGLMHNPEYDFDDIGLSADTAFALAEIGGHDATVDQITAAIEPRAEAEWYSYTFDGVTTTYAGSLAKALVLAQTAGADPTSFGGNDLVAMLEDRVAVAAPIAGRIQDENNAFGDANVIGQAYAAQGLAAATSPRAADALSFLLQQQCSEGYFRLDLADKADLDQSCDAGKDAGESAPDTDATALVVLALQAQDADPVVGAALDDAEAWLLDQQRADGSFGGGPSTEAPNTNSTGIAAWALGDRGRVEAAERAAGWVRGRQAVNVGPCAPWAAAEVGAVAYNAAAHRAGQTDGIVVTRVDQWRRSTTQAVPALQYAPELGTEREVLASPDYVRAGRKASVGVLGADPGEALCLTRGPATQVGAADNAGEATIRIRLPRGTGTRLVTAHDAAGEIGSVELHALGSLTVPFRLKRSVELGDRQVVHVSGLAPGEPARVVFRDRELTGRADADGDWTARFRVGRPTGEATVKVFGQFRNRSSAQSFTITR